MTAAYFKRIWHNSRAASAVEFALLAPVFFGLLFGVVQVGVYMQNYNAVRSLATDAARFAAVEYQKNNKVSTTTMENNIESLGVSAPYFLNSDNLTVQMTEVSPSSVNGARQFTLNLTYALPQLTGGIAIQAFTLTHSRPVFVLKG